jgi:DNA-damage-inducible protein J
LVAIYHHRQWFVIAATWNEFIYEFELQCGLNRTKKSMANNPTVRARINGKIREEASAVLAEIGLTPSDAFRLLMIRIAQDHSLPFDLLKPNKKTVEAINAAKEGQVKSFSNLQELIGDLHAED